MQPFSKPIVEIIRQRYSSHPYLVQPIHPDLQQLVFTAPSGIS